MEHSNLNSHQRRQVSRGLKRLIAREQNEVIRLLRELKGAIRKGTETADTSDVWSRRIARNSRCIGTIHIGARGGLERVGREIQKRQQAGERR